MPPEFFRPEKLLPPFHGSDLFFTYRGLRKKHSAHGYSMQPEAGSVSVMLTGPKRLSGKWSALRALLF